MLHNWHTPLCFCCVGYPGSDVDAGDPERSSGVFSRLNIHQLRLTTAHLWWWIHFLSDCLLWLGRVANCVHMYTLLSAYVCVCYIWKCCMTQTNTLLSSSASLTQHSDFTVIVALSKASWGHYMELQCVHPSTQQHPPISQLSSFARGFRRLVIFMQNHLDQTASALIPGVEPGECDPYRQTLSCCRGGSHYICTETFLTCIFPPRQWCNEGKNPAPSFAL